MGVGLPELRITMSSGKLRELGMLLAIHRRGLLVQTQYPALVQPVSPVLAVAVPELASIPSPQTEIAPAPVRTFFLVRPKMEREDFKCRMFCSMILPANSSCFCLGTIQYEQHFVVLPFELDFPVKLVCVQDE